MNYAALALTIAYYLAVWSLAGLAYALFLITTNKGGHRDTLFGPDQHTLALIVAIAGFSLIGPLFMVLAVINRTRLVFAWLRALSIAKATLPPSDDRGAPDMVRRPA